MADELITYELNGKQFQVRVPKGSDDDFIHKAAQLHYNTKYATEAGPSLPTVNGPDLTQTPEFKKQAEAGSKGFWESLKDSASGIFGNPQNYAAPMPSTQQLNYNDPNDPSKESFSESIKHLPDIMQDDKKGGSFYKATHGNISGALGDIVIPLAMAAVASPKIRGAVHGGVQGLADAATDVNIISKRNSLPAALGGIAGAFTHGWPGFLAGSTAGAIVPEIPGILKEGVKGAIVGAADRPLIPQIIGEPNYNINKPHPVDISNSAPGRNMPPGIDEGERFNIGRQPHSIMPERAPLITPPSNSYKSPSLQIEGAPKQLNQAPIITPPPVLRPPLQLGPATQEFWKGPSSEPNLDMMMRGVDPNIAPNLPNPSNPATRTTIQNPGVMRTLLDPNRIESNPKMPDVKVPKTETQQVPANTKSVTEELPSSLFITPKPNPAASALKAAKSVMKKVDFKPNEKIAEIESKKAPSDTDVWNMLDKAFPTKSKGGKLPEVKPPGEKKSEIESSKVEETKDTKPHFTHELMGKIARSMGEPKVTLQEVGRFIHENDLGTYQEGKFDKNYGAGKSTKTEPSTEQKNTKAAKEKLIHQGILKYIKDHPEEF